jgi:hypothetical protein
MENFRIQDEHPRLFFSIETVFGLKILNFVDADPESFWPWIRDGKIWIRDPV